MYRAQLALSGYTDRLKETLSPSRELEEVYRSLFGRSSTSTGGWGSFMSPFNRGRVAVFYSDSCVLSNPPTVGHLTSVLRWRNRPPLSNNSDFGQVQPYLRLPS